MSSSVLVVLDLKCLVFGGPDASKAHALVNYGNKPVLVQALTQATDTPRLTWDFVTAGGSFQKSYDLQGNTASCFMNKAGELIAMGSWSGIQASDNRTRRGLVYNPYNPLPSVGGRATSNALWMEINVAANIDNSVKEWAQLMIDTGADDGSAMEIALTGSHLLIRRLHAIGNSRELVGLGGWVLPRPLDDSSTVQLQHFNNSLYVFSAYGANDTSLVRIPFNPSSTFSSQISAGPPPGTTAIDISSSNNKCDWDSGFFTAALDNKFYLLCQGLRMTGTVLTKNLFVYDNTTDSQSPKLGAAVPMTETWPNTKISLFQPLQNRTFALLVYNKSYDYPKHVLLSLSGPDIGKISLLPESWISVEYDTLSNNILPNEVKTSEESSVVALILGFVVVLTALVFLVRRHRRRRRSRKIRQKDADMGLYGLEPLGASGISCHSSHSSYGAKQVAGAAQPREANTQLQPTVCAAPQASISPSPAISAGLPVSSWPTSPPRAASAAPLSSMTLSLAPSAGSPTSGPSSANTFQMELQQLGFSSHPRPNVVTTVND